MPSNGVKEQLQLALNEQTPEKILYEIWQTSRSVKVRKAVASNPNAGPWLLRAAARLYLEEVLSNPGFSVLELFDDDPWISKISMAYADPWDFLLKYGSSMYHSRVGTTDYFGWAALLSPKLNASSLEKVIGFMTAAGFKRALRNKSLFSKLAAIYSEADASVDAWPFSLETMISIHREGIIKTEQLFTGLSNYGPGSTSTRKGVYIKYIKSFYANYLLVKSFAEKDFVAKLLAKSLLISRPHVMHWVLNCLSSQEIEEWAGELYCKVLGYMSNYPVKNPSLVQDSIRAVGSIAARYVKKKFFSEDCTSESIRCAYEFLKSHGLESQKFSKFGLILSSRECMAELDKCSVAIKKFFCKAGCLGNWASATGSDVKYKIINEVNWHIYLNEGIQISNLLFDKCSVRKVVSLESDIYVF